MTPTLDPHRNPLASSATLVIGGSAGLGLAVAAGAVSHGSHVYISSSSAERVAAAVSELRTLATGRQRPGDSVIVAGGAADLSDAATIEAAVRGVLEGAVAALGGPVDHVVYTAGDATRPVPLAAASAADAYDAWTVRYLGPLMVAKLLAAHPGRYVRDRAASSVTLTSGVASRRPRAGIATIVGVAGATEALGRALAMELAPIRVNTVLPGAVRTERLERLGREVIGAYREKSLVREIGDPDDVAEAYLYCMRCAFVTGQELVVDGGFTYL